MNYIKLHNGTLEEYPLNFKCENPDVNLEDILQLIQTKQIEISIHPYGLYNRSAIGGSYSLFSVDWCLIVPIQKEIPRYLYIVRPLNWRTWILILISVFYISLVLNIFDWIIEDKGVWRYGRLGEGVLNAIAFIINIPPTFRLDSAHWKHITGVYIFLLVLGFIVTSYYTTLLASFMTTTVFRDNLNTIDDLIDAGIPIMTQNFDAERLLPRNTSSEKIKSILQIVSPEIYNGHRNKFNQSFAYLASSDRWKFLVKQQQYSQRPMFRFSDICFIQNLPVNFLMEYDSHLGESLKDFIMRVHSSGLVYYWAERDFELAVSMGEMKRYHNQVGASPVTLETLRYVWLLWSVGLTLSAFVFAVELCTRIA